MHQNNKIASHKSSNFCIQHLLSRARIQAGNKQTTKLVSNFAYIPALSLSLVSQFYFNFILTSKFVVVVVVSGGKL